MLTSRRLLSVLAGVSLLALSACGSESPGGDSDSDAASPPPPPDASGGDGDGNDAEMPLPTPDGDAGGLPDGGSLGLPDASEVDGAEPPPDTGPPIVNVPRPPETGEINFRACAENTRECGSMQVPLDYENAAGGTVRLAVMRSRAKGARVGTLLLNPGGPGSSAIDALGSLADNNTRSPLLQHFDLVAFDPRGVGYSTALNCHETLQQLYAVDPTPDDDAEWALADAAAAKFAADCQAAHGPLLAHVHTRNVARDMDRVRAALGEEKISYLGFSYGSSIGAFYGELFPERVAGMVLDAPVDLNLSALELMLQQAKGFEVSLERYFGWCRAVPARCNFTRGADPKQAFHELAAAIDASPVAATMSDRPLGPGEFVTAVGATMYGGEAGWRALSTGLDRVKNGDGNALMAIADDYLQRELDGTYTNREEANHAVNCVDRRPMTVAEIRAAVPRFASEAPFFGVPALVAQLVCAHWAAKGEDIPAPHAPSAPPIVVIGTVGDPATPYAWAQTFATDLTSAVLLTWRGEGHTAYGRGDACIDGAVNTYLFHRVIPAENACGAPVLPLTVPSLGAAREPLMRWTPRFAPR